ncbi:MAG: hypothetical protein ACE5LS_07110 [Thermoplasmata archaeon]
MSEICNECGRSVRFGSGFFLYRVRDLHTIQQRRALGKPFPEGDYLCMDCATNLTLSRRA